LDHVEREATVPGLIHGFDMHAEVTPDDIGVEPFGHRRIANITSGYVSGDRLYGTIIGAGADWMLRGTDGFGRIDARLTVRTDESAMIYIQYFGMPTASLLVGHGGHATTVLALAHGLPVLTIPLEPHLDHRMIGEAVRDAGAGRVLDPGATPAAIRDAVAALLVDPVVPVAAERVGARLRATDGAARAAEEIEAVAGAGDMNRAGDRGQS
jgi:hypothetical protein